MAALGRSYDILFVRVLRGVKFTPRLLFSTETKSEIRDASDEMEFRVLELYPEKKRASKKYQLVELPSLPPREKRMPIDQDWKTVWPTARSFQPSVVPLPLYQGYTKKGAPPHKNANAEMMKIPNFLHLTPPAIKAHCAVLKQFCTEWPRGLETDEDCEKHFPLEVISSDYCHSSPTIRDERARIATVKIKLSALGLDYHARDKFIRLVGDRYDSKTDTVAIVADRCPMRKQNYDYIIYVLTALYGESWKYEAWESEKTEADMEKFFFEGSRNEAHAARLRKCVKEATDKTECTTDETMKSPEVVNYGNSLSTVLNEEESLGTLQQYKENVCRLLGIEIPHETSQI